MNAFSKRPLPKPFAENGFLEKRLLVPLLSEYSYAICVGCTSELILSSFEKRSHRVRRYHSSMSDGVLRISTVLGRVGNRSITDCPSRDLPKAFRYCFRIFSPLPKPGPGNKCRARKTEPGTRKCDKETGCAGGDCGKGVVVGERGGARLKSENFWSAKKPDN